MKFVKVMDHWFAGIISVDIPGGIETTAGWVNNGDWEEVPDTEKFAGAMCLFDGNYAAYLPLEWPQLKFWDMDMQESFFVTDIDFEHRRFICSDGKIRDRAQCVVSSSFDAKPKEESNG